MGYRVSKRAGDELDAIIVYTIQTWGERQAAKYIDEMESIFEILANSPGMGRAVEGWAKATRRIERGSHVIFYRPTDKGILIQRILHKSMLPRR